jgi:hypothetical protein
MKPFIRWALLVALVCGGAGVAEGASLDPKPAPPRSRYAAEYREMMKPYWRTSFPHLGTHFEVLAPSTGNKGKGVYNCIAHTLRIYHVWVWPGTRVADFDRIYGKAGYRRVRGLDFSYKPTVDKVVLYAKFEKGRILCTHGSRQLADGTWTSKLGGGPLIRHATPNSVAGPSYGRPIAVYVKARRPLLPVPRKTTTTTVKR